MINYRNGALNLSWPINLLLLWTAYNHICNNGSTDSHKRVGIGMVREGPITISVAAW